METIVDSSIANNKIKQEIVFKNNGKEIVRHPSSIAIDGKLMTSEDSIKILDNVIYQIGVLEGKDSSVYTIYGAGSCNACPELFAFYNQSGKVIWLSYSNKNKIYKSIGDFDNVCKLYGIDSLKWQNKEYKRASLEL